MVGASFFPSLLRLPAGVAMRYKATRRDEGHLKLSNLVC